MSDRDSSVRSRICKAFGEMGAEAATDRVITALTNAASDQDSYVRRAACAALGKLGEQGSTNDTTVFLLEVIRKDDGYAREVACKALEQMISEGANNQVIGALRNAVSDKSKIVREEACKILGNIARKEATKEVIAILLEATHDQESRVTAAAYEALGNIGEKVTTDDVIAALMDIKPSSRRFYQDDSQKRIELTISSNEGLRNWKPEVIEKVFQRLREDRWIKLERMRPNHLLNVYFESENEAWLGLLAYAALVQGISITIVDSKITIYHGNETIECCISRTELKDKLLDAFKEANRKLKEMSATLPGSDGHSI